MTDSPEERDPVERLAAEFVDRQRRGENVSIEDYAGQHPDLAEDIRELFPFIAAMEKLKLQKEKTGTGRASLGPVKLERLGDFRIIREIGRGGMGVVFEAEQESLGRRVAIKVLPRHALFDAEHLQRFERETRIAANLHHTNIVPVFGVSEQDGFHYFVMQFIDGQGLDKEIERLSRSQPDPSYWNRVARIGLQAARALDYAHTQGTLHRDIKPANLLIDDQDVVWVSDFGVAKALESVEVTRTGDITGTLRYMAPERFQGQEDARCDQYSLGLTLYELLTLQPAYGESDRTRLIHNITHVDPAPPHKLNPSIPRDLETVVLTALARDPAHRYPSAIALADDLQRFLEDRPVQARRITSIERLWRWSRRNPIISGLGSAVLALLIMVTVISTKRYLETKAANVRVQQALEGEKGQREKAQATSKLALEVLDRIYAQLAPLQDVNTPEYTIQDSEGELIEVPLEPVLTPETAALLENLLVFYDRLSEQQVEDVRLLEKVAQANQRVGVIQLLLGHYQQARTALFRSLDRYEALQKETGGSPRLRVEIASIHNEIGTAYRLGGRLEKAGEAHASARKLLEPADEQAMQGLLPEHRFELARTYYLLGTRIEVQPPAGPPGGRPGSGPPPPHLRPGPPLPPRHPFAATGKKQLEKAVGILKKLIEEHPSEPEHRHLLACCFRDRPPDFDSRSENLQSLQEAAIILESLTRDFPHVSEYRHDLCETYTRFDIRGPGVTSEVLSEVEELLTKGFAIAEELVAQHPNVPSYRTSQVHILLKLGEVLHRQDRLEAAAMKLRKAFSIQSGLVDRYPDSSIYRIWLAETRRTLSRALGQEGRMIEARSLLEEAIEDLETLWKKEPRREHLRGLLGACCHDLAEILIHIGDEDAAQEMLRRARHYHEPR